MTDNNDTSTQVGAALTVDQKAKRDAQKAARLAAASAPAKVAPRILEDVSKQVAANVIAASNKVRRLSRISPIADRVAEMLKGGAKHVAIMAKAVECSEKDIRHAIDRLRANGYKIDRTAYMTFGYAKGFKAPKVKR